MAAVADSWETVVDIKTSLAWIPVVFSYRLQHTGSAVILVTGGLANTVACVHLGGGGGRLPQPQSAPRVLMMSEKGVVSCPRGYSLGQ